MMMRERKKKREQKIKKKMRIIVRGMMRRRKMRLQKMRMRRMVRRRMPVRRMSWALMLLLGPYIPPPAPAVRAANQLDSMRCLHHKVHTAMAWMGSACTRQSRSIKSE